MTSSTMQARPASWLPALALLAAPAASAADASSNAVVIDFDQGRLILGWIGLWLVAALTFALCADKRIQLMTRLAAYLEQRARRRSSQRADAAIRSLAQDDPRIPADLIAATGRIDNNMPVPVAPQATYGHSQATHPVARTPAPSRNLPARGFRTTP